MFYSSFLFTGPSFVKEMRNVSVAVGRDATIDCHVSNAEDYKVTYTLIITKLKLSIDNFSFLYLRNIILYQIGNH